MLYPLWASFFATIVELCDFEGACSLKILFLTPPPSPFPVFLHFSLVGIFALLNHCLTDAEFSNVDKDIDGKHVINSTVQPNTLAQGEEE